jgi:regulator of replication initiation timing
MNLTFDKYDAYPPEQTTKWFAHVADALRKDFQSYGEKFAVYRITKDIAAAMPMGNRQALKRGESAGRILLAGKNLAGTGYGYVKGNDLAKTIAYFYWYLPLQHWTHLTETVKGFGKEWAELTKIKPQPADEVVDAFYKEISKVSLDGGRVAADLRRIADIIQPIEMKVKTLSQQVEQQNLTIVKQSNENTKLTQAIERMRKLLAELSDRIDAEKDQDKKAIMIKTYHEYLKKFENEL